MTTHQAAHVAVLEDLLAAEIWFGGQGLPIAEALIAAIDLMKAEPLAYANPADYAHFVSGEDHTFTVYRYGEDGHDVAIYAAAPTEASR